jgi:Retrotransposon gag protein
MDQVQSAIQSAVAAVRIELMQQFNSTIEGLNNEILQLKLQLQQSKEKKRPKSALPDPEKFTGTALKFHTWLPSIRAKLRVDGEAIGDPIARFYYVYLNLDSSVQAMVLPQLAQAEESDHWDYNSILDQLSRVYDNPNRIQEAEDRLLAVKQDSNESITAYIARFERILYEARGQDWPDVTKISAFRKGLNPTIRHRLYQQLDLPRTYPEFLRIVQRLSSTSHSAATAPSLASSHPTTSNRPTHNHSTDPMDINPLAIHAIDPAPRARSTSPVQREQYRREGLCVRCGASDHWVHSCSLQPYRDRTAELVALEHRDDNDGSDDDSTSGYNSEY